jgi:hypothetical protein
MKYIKITFFHESRVIPMKRVVFVASVPGPKWRNWLENPPSAPIKLMYPVK